MSDSKNPLARLDHQELLWLTGILKDACHERLEKNLVSQAFEDRLYQRGGVKGRLDPRPFLKIWEPRYRKFLDVASELHAALEAKDAKVAAESLRAKFEEGPSVQRHGPTSARLMPVRKTRARKI
jgi:hypothetical protein